MRKWEYDISFHSLDELGIPEEDIEFSAKQVVSCDIEGHCYFNDVMRLYIDTFTNTFNNKGADGWELLQLEYHRGSLVCFWKREAAE